MKTVIVIIPDKNIGTRLCEYLNEKYGVTAKLQLDLHGVEEVQADAFIIYRKCVDDMRFLDGIEGEIALLYGKASIPSSDKALTYQKLTGNLPECVDGFLEPLLQDNCGDLNEELNWDWDESEAKHKRSNKFTPVRSVALFSPGGGVGKTTAAVHLAKLAEQARINVGLIETDEDKGGVLRYLGKSPAQEGLDSLEKAVWDDEVFFSENIKRIVQKVGRIQVVPMVSTFNGLSCNMQNVSSLFTWANSQFDLTLYDLPPRLRDVMTFSVLQAVDQVVLVAEPTDILMDALQKHLKLCQEVEQFSNLPKKYRLLVNKVPEKNGLSPEEMADALGLPLLGSISADVEHYDRMINRAKFEIPSDSSWRKVFFNMDLGGDASAINLIEGTKGDGPGGKAKKKRKGFLSFFFC
ncbi:ATPase involved in chromosome partitioning [Desulfitobacterium dehalogenans ATCC 51507]|uniref:ATPase involved in chromosome partitioning n=1 Tax=Desulfitobacterium dehalogenans (strain ATCC 51507 / DSM 9161 / JW/IU-DC1) TaxID=756499 RepID=I4ABX9_DESDJ|nr:AAA family ATPase [Desulfitobacterium dehalogenans]AFM01464.1 ATPase involved in chromosome partitioning [Desulfitobacterium dehalogenans ATCC 51507]